MRKASIALLVLILVLGLTLPMAAPALADTGGGTPASATVTLSNLQQAYDGTPKEATATTDPPGVSVSITYDGSTTPPTDAGSYAVVAKITDPNYTGSDAHDTLVIDPASATVTLSNLQQTYDGTPKEATATTDPPDVSVSITYDGSATPPTDAGSYAVMATITDPNYTGSDANDTLVIDAATEPTVASVSTDKQDYAPEETVIITGEGFISDSTIAMTVVRPDGSINDPAHGIVGAWEVTAEGNGAFQTTYQLNGIFGTYTVTATDGTNTATTTFTDGTKVGSVSVSPMSLTVTQGTAASYTVTVTRGVVPGSSGRFDATLTVIDASPSIPGVAISFNPQPVSFVSTDASKTSTLTITTGSLLGTYTFKVKATKSDAAGDYGNSSTVTLIVEQVAADTEAPTVTIDIPDYINIANEAAVPVTITSDEDGDYSYDISDGVTHITGSGSITSGVAVNLSPDLSGLADGAITADASVEDAAGNTGNAPQDTATKDTVEPTVTINQATGQADPTNASPINFTVVFNEPVSDFATGDVTLGGSARATTATVTEISPNDGTTYNVAVSGMTSYGNVTASIAAGVAQDAATNDNEASTSTDNIVWYIYPTKVIAAISAPSVQYSDWLTLWATVSGDPSIGEIPTGTVLFTINGIDYGPATVEGTGIATLSTQIWNMPGGPFDVKAFFTSGDILKWADSNNSGQPPPKLTVLAEDAARAAQSFWTGEDVYWTPTETSNGATVTLIATLQDCTDGMPGDIRAATVSFFSSSSPTGPWSKISSAQNLPVGLVDLYDGSMGTASAIAQFNLGSNGSPNIYYIKIVIGGAYSGTDVAPIVVARAAKGQIVGNVNVANVNSAGFIKGASGETTEAVFYVTYTKSGSNPKGRAEITIASYYKSNGILDTNLHYYQVTTNAIASLNVSGNTATFSSKATVKEMDGPNGNFIQTIDAGAILQLAMVDNGASTDTISITIQKSQKNGGLWFSSNWNVTKTIPTVTTDNLTVS